MKLGELFEKQWSGDVKTNKHPPSKLFADGNAIEISNWLKKSHNDNKSAIDALVFYINRAGKNLSRERLAVLNDVKSILQAK